MDLCAHLKGYKQLGHFTLKCDGKYFNDVKASDVEYVLVRKWVEEGNLSAWTATWVVPENTSENGLCMCHIDEQHS